MEAAMEEQKNHLLPSNYVSIIQLKQRWLEEKEQRQRELEKPEEQNRDKRQEIQPGELGEISEEMRLMANLNLQALEIDSQVRNPHQPWKSKHNRFASVKNQGAAEASRKKEDQLVVDIKLDGPPDKGSENKANDLELAVKRKRRKKNKKKQTTVVDEKNLKSEGGPTQDQNCEVAVKHREHLPEVNGKKIRGRGRNTDEKKRIEDEYGPNSGNVDQTWEIGDKSRHFSINDETKTEDNRFMKRNNRIHQGYRDARVNGRLKSEGGPTQDQNCEVAVKHREHLPEVNGKKIRGIGRNTDEKKKIEDKYGPNSGNVDQTWEIGDKSRHFSKTEDNRFMKRYNRIYQGYRDARVNGRLNRQEVQKEKVWVRKGEVSSGVSYGFHSRVSGGSIDGPSGEQERLNK